MERNRADKGRIELCDALTIRTTADAPPNATFSHRSAATGRALRTAQRPARTNILRSALALLASTAIVAAVSAPHPAWSATVNGVNGGNASGFTGGTAGTGAAGTAGGQAGQSGYRGGSGGAGTGGGRGAGTQAGSGGGGGGGGGANFSMGGGGGGGVASGGGGGGGNPDASGSSGTAAGGNGNPGSSGRGGGGGGGGGYASSLSTGTTIVDTFIGGNGGNGSNGVASSGISGGGGGGGGGGIGLVLTGSGQTYTISGSAIGGNGGTGGNSGDGISNGGGGGAGGYAVSVGSGAILINQLGATLTGGAGGNGGSGANGGGGGGGGAGAFVAGGALENSGTIVGGAGGSGTSGGANGTGGPGILGQGATIINSGTISSYGGSSTARAVLFTSGTNSLTLKEGSTLTGTAGKSGGTAKLVIEADTAAQTLDVTSIGAYSSVSTLKYQGFDTFEKIGAATLTLSGTTSVVTPWTVKGGILSISQANSLGANSSTLTLDGGALEITGTSITALGTGRPVTIGSAGGTITIVDASASVIADGVLSGSTGSFTKSGSGKLRLVGANSFAGATFVTGGTLELAGPNTYTGTTTISNGGTLLVSSGSVSGNIATDNGSTSGAVIFSRSGAITYGAILSGSGTLAVAAGNVTLTGANTLSGNTSVSGQLNLIGGGSLAGSVDVQSGGSLRGDLVGLTSGSIGGAVTIHNGAALLSVSGTTTLTTGALTFGSNSLLVTTLVAPSATAAVLVNGNLVLDGTLATVTSGGPSSSPADGTYRLFDYTGTLTDNGLAIASVPAYALYKINTAVSHQVDLIVIAGQWWNGTTTTSGGSSVQGGDGTWDVAGAATNWTNQAGATAQAWTQGGVAVFGGAAGTVTISGATAPNLVGAFFVTDGYVINGGALTTSAFTAGAVPQFSVESGTTGTISSSIGGTDGLEKVGLGTLVLAGANTYTGGTTVSAGTLQLGNATGVGSVVGDIVDDAALVFANPTAQTFGGVVSGSGTLEKAGAGTLTLTANNTYTGTTTISAGTLQLGNGGNAGSVAGAITNNAALIFNRSDDVNFSGIISGGGTLEKAGSNKLTLSGTNTYSGYTTVSSGTLEITNASALGATSAGTTVTSGAALIVNNTSGSASVMIPSAEPLTISGTGVLNGGALRLIGSQAQSQIQLDGSVTLAADASIFNALFISTLTGPVTGSNVTLTAGSIGAGQTLIFGNSLNLGATGGFTVTGGGSVELRAANTYGGLTTVSSGVLSIADGGALGDASSGTVVASGATLALHPNAPATGLSVGNEALTLSGAGYGGFGALLNWDGENSYAGGITLAADSRITVSSGSLTLSGDIGGAGKNLELTGSGGMITGAIGTGTGTVTVAASANWVLAGANSYTGDTIVAAGGALQLGHSSTTEGSVAGNIQNDGSVNFYAQADHSYAGVISGTGSVSKGGSGTQTLTGANTYTGGTTINFGTLSIGDGGTTGSVLGNIANNAALVFNRSNDMTYSGVLSGGGSVNKQGAGTLTLSGTSTLTGTTTVSAGTLSLTGTLPGAIDVKSDATLLGSSTSIAGAVTIENGGTLSSASGTYFQTTDLSFGANSNLAFTAGAPTTVAAVSADGNVIFGGTLQVAAGTGFTTGTYRLIDYTGSLTGSGMTVMPAAHSLYAIDTSTSGQVNLIAAVGQWWNGSNTTGGSQVVGGNGTWSVQAGTTNWTNQDGSTASPWGQGGIAVFGGTAGTVTIAGATNPVVVGMDFVTDGYTLTGQSITLAQFTPSLTPAIMVDTGVTATVASVLDGSAGLEKTGAGTLVLTASNNYSGQTTVSAGTLQIGNGGTTGSIGGSIANNAAVVFDRSNDISYYGIISGTGTLEKKGAGTLILAGLNSYTGGTTISEGTLQIGDGILPLTAFTGNVVNNAALAFNQALNTTFGGVISGSGSVTKLGMNTLTLTGANTYTGGTTISAGTLQIGTNGTTGQITGNILNNAALVFDTNLGDSQVYTGVISGSGTLRKELGGDLTFTADQTFTGLTTLTGGQLILGNGAASGMLGGNVLLDGGNLVFNRSDTATYAGNILSGSGGALYFKGGGTTILTGNVQTPGSIVLLGGSTAQIGDGTTHGTLSAVQVLLADGTLAFNIADSMTTDIYVTGDGGISKSGNGTLTLTGNNDYAGGTVVSAGTLQIGDGGVTGSVGGAIANSGTVVFDRSDNVTASGAITGTGALVQAGTGTLTLVGSNSAGAGTTVSGGTLEILSGVTLVSDIVVQSGGTLQGETSGTAGASINGAVSVQDGGTLRAAPTSTAGVYGLSMTSLTLSNGANVDVILGSNTGVGVFSTGALTLDGVLNVTDAGAMSLGVYRLIDYTTRTADNGLVLGNTPLQYAYTIDVVPNHVNLTVLSGDMLYWNGSTTTQDGTIHGGNGTWTANAGQTNWLTQTLNQSRAWNSQFAVFAGTPGQVTVDNGSGPVSTTGMQFMVNGYAVSGGVVTLAALSGQTQVRVGDGTSDGAGFVATVASVLDGTTGLEKTDLGTLILTGTNTYTGNTTVTQGTLQIGNGGATGSIGGDAAVASGATLAFDRSGTVSFAGVVSGNGALTQAGPGTLILAGNNTYTGGTQIASGSTLQIGDGGTAGSIVGPVINSGALVFDRSDATSFAGAISGTGTLEKAGAGTLTLSGTNTFTGATTISGGTLSIIGGSSLADGARLTVNASGLLNLVDADETIGSLAGSGNVTLNSHCLITGGDGTSSTFSGGISGSGCVTKTGDGTMTLTGTSTYSGTTTVSGGTIAIGSADAIGTGPLALVGAGTLEAVDDFAFTRGISLTSVDGSGGGTVAVDYTQTLTVSGVVSGNGALTKTGGGTLVLSGTNTFSGATTVDGGQLSIMGGSSLSDTARLTIAGGATVALIDADETVGSLAGAGTVTLDGHCLSTGGDGTSSSFSGSLNGPGCLTKTGDGTLTLSGTNTLTGPVTVSGGAVQVSAASALGSGPLALSGSGALQASGTFTYANAVSLTPVSGTGGGTFDVDDAQTLTLTGAITGLGNLAKTGTGTLIIAGTNTASGATNVNAGTLVARGGNALSGESAVTVASGAQLIVDGADATAGSLAGSGGVQLSGASLSLGGDNTTTTYSGTLSGTGGLTKTGTGTLTLAGANSYSGDTAVRGGGVAVTGSLTDSDVYVYDQATLSGGGTITKTVHVLSGGTIAGSMGTGLTMGSLDMQAGATMSVSLGAPSGSGVFNINGNVNLAGTLAVNPNPGFGFGIYRIANYGGSLNYAGMTVSGLPANLEGGVQTVIPGQINLYVDDANNPTEFWNGANTTPTQAVLGGTGTWTGGGQTNWVNESGTVSKTWNSGFAVFQGSAGTVTVDDTDAQVSAVGMQFVTSGYVVIGDSIALTGAALIRVGDGTPEGATTIATIASVLTGTAGLEKSDYGTLVLTGANTYTGGTTISAGTLQIGNGGTTGSILGDVTDNGALAFNQSGDVTFAGSISGSGTLSQIGSGTLTLTGASTFSGGTTVSSGTLAVGNSSALGTGRLAMAEGTTLAFAADGLTLANTVTLTGDPTISVASGQTGTLAGVLGDGTQPGDIVKTGGGTLVLAADNTYSGGTTVSAGTLQLGNGGTSGSILGNVTNNATLAFNRSDDITFAGVISGSGALVQAGSGTLTLTGANTYTGGTTVSAGTLAGNTSSLQGNIVDNAAVVFNQTTTGTYASTISGTGSLTKTGAGTLILTGENTFTGGTTIWEGTLQIGNGGTAGSLVGAIVNNTALVFNRSDTYNFPGTITGPGSVTIVGGAVNFTGAGGYAGPISVSNATFELAPGAVSASSYTIGSGGVIGGTGTIGGLTVLSGGTVSPGYSPGTLTVNGNVSFAAGSVYQVDITPQGAHDLIIASGTATISGGTVQVVATQGTYAPGTKYTILTAQGGVSGQFSGLTVNYAYLDPTLSYDPNNVYLTLARNAAAFADAAYTTNQKATAAAVESLGAGNAVYSAVLQLSGAQASAAFDALSGEAYASASSVMQQQSSYLREAVGTRVRQGLVGQSGWGQETAKLAPGYDATVWTQAYGAWGQTAGNGNTASVDRTIGGFFTGIDAALSEAARFGIVGGYSRSTFNVDARSSSGDIDNYDLGLYGGAKFGSLSLLAAASYTWHDVSVDRSVAFSGFSGLNTADYRAGTTQVFGEAAWRVDLSKTVDPKTFGAASIEPFANLAYVNLSSNNFTETGSAAALTGSAETENTLYSTLGVRAATTFQLANGAALTPHASLGWQHAFGDVNSSASLAFVSGGSAFTVSGVPIARDAALVGAGLDYAFSKSVSASVTYSGQFGSGTEDNAFKGTINIKF